MGLQMVGELIDPVREQRDLHIGAAGVLIVHAQRLEVLSF
jgi:hypothetical protein